jgi:hypothetical protein
MKEILRLSAFIIVCILLSFHSKANTTDSTQVVVKVYGNATCASEIQSIAQTAVGVLHAVSFDAVKHELTLQVQSSTFDQNLLFFALASKGYDAGNVRAKEGIYNQLAEGCKYERMPDDVVRD